MDIPGGDSPEDILAANNLRQIIHNSLNDLPEDIRTTISLREFEGLTYEQISEVTGCPVGTVRSRIFRGREEIQKKIAPSLNHLTERKKAKEKNIMTEGIKERISALIDGELSEFEVRRVLEEIESDPELKEYWSKLHISRDGMKDRSLGFFNNDISKRVAAELGKAVVDNSETKKLFSKSNFYMASSIIVGMVFSSNHCNGIYLRVYFIT